MEPVIFGAESVRAMLEGRKTVTRRTGGRWGHRKVGDVLRVREDWGTHERPRDLVDGIVFLADGHFQRIGNTPEAASLWVALHANGAFEGKSRVLFMPGWLSRLQIRLVSIDRQPLQAMVEQGEAEAVREGAASIEEYRRAWDALNPSRLWETNPDVFRISFEVLGPVYGPPLFDGLVDWAHLSGRSVRRDGVLVVSDGKGHWNIQDPDGRYWVTDGPRPRRRWYRGRDAAVGVVDWIRPLPTGSVA